MRTSNCPACHAPIPPEAARCEYCGQYVERESKPQTEDANLRPLPAWTQGISREGYANGNFDAVDYPAMPLSEALRMLENLPIPPGVADPGDFCPPTIGFGERNISRNEDGTFFLWPEDRECTLEEARKIVRQIYEHNAPASR